MYLNRSDSATRTRTRTTTDVLYVRPLLIPKTFPFYSILPFKKTLTSLNDRLLLNVLNSTERIVLVLAAAGLLTRQQT